MLQSRRLTALQTVMVPPTAGVAAVRAPINQDHHCRSGEEILRSAGQDLLRVTVPANFAVPVEVGRLSPE